MQHFSAKTDELNVQQCDAGVVMEHNFPWVLVIKEQSSLINMHLSDLSDAENEDFVPFLSKKVFECFRAGCKQF